MAAVATAEPHQSQKPTDSASLAGEWQEAGSDTHQPGIELVL